MLLSFLFKTFCLSVKKVGIFGVLSLESVDLTLQIGLDSLHLLVFALQVEVAELEVLFEFDGLLLVLVDLRLELGLGPDDFCLEGLADLGLLLGEGLHLLVPVVDDVLQLVDLPVEEVELVVVGVLEQGELGLLDALELVPEVAELDVGDALGLEDFVLEVLVLLLEELDRVLVVVLDLEVLGEDLLDLEVLGVDDLLQLRVFVVEGLDLVEVLLLEVLDFGVEVVLELGLQRVDFLLVLRLLIDEVVPEPVLLLPQLANFKVGLLAQPHQFHIEVTDFVLLLLAVFLELPNFKFIFLVVVEVMPLQVLYLQVVLVLELTDLHVLHVLDIGNLLLDLLHLVEQLPVLEVAGGSPGHRQTFVFVLPDLDLVLLLVDQLSKSLVLPEQLVVVLDDELGLVLEFVDLLALGLEDVDLLD